MTFEEGQAKVGSLEFEFMEEYIAQPTSLSTMGEK